MTARSFFEFLLFLTVAGFVVRFALQRMRADGIDLRHPFRRD